MRSFTQDLPNQIRCWDKYQAAIKDHGVSAGQFLSPSCAEWFSGTLSLFEVCGLKTMSSYILIARFACRMDDSPSGDGPEGGRERGFSCAEGAAGLARD